MFEAAIEDISKNFKPDLIFISAGFDAHLTDPLGQLRLEDEDFVSMTRIVKQWADECAADGSFRASRAATILKRWAKRFSSHVA